MDYCIVSHVNKIKVIAFYGILIASIAFYLLFSFFNFSSFYTGYYKGMFLYSVILSMLSILYLLKDLAKHVRKDVHLSIRQGVLISSIDRKLHVSISSIEEIIKLKTNNILIKHSGMESTIGLLFSQEKSQEIITKIYSLKQSL